MDTKCVGLKMLHYSEVLRLLLWSKVFGVTPIEYQENGHIFTANI